jgi:hypothetical protein
MTTQNFISDPTLIRALSHAISYTEFYNLTAALVADKNTTGPVKNETRIQATQLNLQRLNRLNKTTQLLPVWETLDTESLQHIEWLLITEAWCGDGAQIAPVINKVAEKLHIPLKIVLRDEHVELIDNYLFRGTRSIPVLLCYHKETGEVIGHWGSRPAEAQQLVDDAKANNIPHDDYVVSLQNWYNQNKTVSLQNELFSFVNDCVR